MIDGVGDVFAALATCVGETFGGGFEEVCQQCYCVGPYGISPPTAPLTIWSILLSDMSAVKALVGLVSPPGLISNASATASHAHSSCCQLVMASSSSPQLPAQMNPMMSEMVRRHTSHFALLRGRGWRNVWADASFTCQKHFREVTTM